MSDGVSDMCQNTSLGYDCERLGCQGAPLPVTAIAQRSGASYRVLLSALRKDPPGKPGGPVSLAEPPTGNFAHGLCFTVNFRVMHGTRAGHFSASAFLLLPRLR